MLKPKRRNPAADLCQCARYWMALRRHPGVFSLADAMMNMTNIAFPRRFADRAAGRALRQEARIEAVEAQVHQVTVLRNGLMFYWLGSVDNNLHYTIDQEFNPRFPHYYTTRPVVLTPDSVVLDVGSCEGLFAFRVLQAGHAKRVVCFEPSERTARYLRLGAEKNALGHLITVENCAVGKSSGRVGFIAEESPTANRIAPLGSQGGGPSVECVCLDDYCKAKNIALRSRDLIKVDAEGSDFDVLLGAERQIRTGMPQIAVTTYHCADHVFQMIEWLKRVQPAYRLRVKGFASWTPQPVPVLLQAAAP